MNKRQVAQYISFLSIPLSIVWLIVDGSIEPIIMIVLGVSNVVSTGFPWQHKKYNSNKQSGTVSFNYNKNNKKYTFGRNDYEFETQWSTASDTSIHIYGRTPTIKKLSIVTDKANISDISDASNYEYTENETPQKGDIVLLKNKYGNYAALKILSIKDRSRNDDIDEVTVEYVLNTGGCSDFRK